MKKALYMLLSGALAFSFTACDDDHAPDWEQQSPFDVKLVSMSVENGATLPCNGSVIDFTYSAPIALSMQTPILLNDQPIANQDKAATVVDGNILRLELPNLLENTDYTLVIPERVVAGVGSQTFAPEVKLSFVTPEGDIQVSPFGTLINPNATAQAVNVYNFLVENHGKKIVSGAMANVSNNNDFASWIKAKTGKDVAFMCYDFIHLPQSGANWIDYNDITPAETQWNANGLVGYMWHWNVPTDEQAWLDKDYDRYGCRPPGSEEGATDFDIERALQEGTWEHEFILEDLAKVAAVFKKLQEKGIPVIWRPLHEAAGDYEYKNPWFWWGLKGGEATKQLWRLMYDQLVNVHGCNNLIWVWTAQYKSGYEAQMAADYPGNEWVDIIGTDIYAENDNSQVKAYNALYNMGEGKKLVTISETGLIQNPDKCFADKAYWSWFNLWYTYNIHETGDDKDTFGNTTESLKAVFDSPYVINRDAMPSLK